MDSTRSAEAVDHLAELSAATAAMATALATLPVDRRTTGLPRWTGRDVGAHLSGVHRWAADIVRTGRRPGRTNLPELPDPIAAEYRAAADELLAVLAGTDPDRPCWTLDSTDRRAGFWARRQLHETLVHLWDVRSAVSGAPLLPDLPPLLCADGVDEFLQVFPPRMGPSSRRPLPGALTLRADDAAATWTVHPDWSVEAGRSGADPATGATDPATGAGASGPAGALLLFVWGRPTGAAIDVTGDGAVVRAFQQAQCRA